jgi:replicative DNA helicase
MTDIEFEQIIIKTIYANPEVSGKIIPELDTGWFTNVDHKYIVNAILEYNSKFSAVPNAIEVKRLLSDQRTVDEFEKCMSINDEDVNTPYILDEIQNFIRKRLGRQVCMDYNEYCSTGKSKGSFADEMAYAETFTFDTKVGFSFFEEPEVIFNDIITNERLYPTGCKAIDEMIGGGLHPKSIL